MIFARSRLGRDASSREELAEAICSTLGAALPADLIDERVQLDSALVPAPRESLERFCAAWTACTTMGVSTRCPAWFRAREQIPYA